MIFMTRRKPVPKPAIIICAFNEEKDIGKTIDLLRESGVKADIFVVNDGSTDKTSLVAKRMGCEVIDLSENKGKANAFFVGVKEVLKRKPTAVLSFDADMRIVPDYAVRNIVKKAEDATKKGRSEMFVAGVEEREDWMHKPINVPRRLSGIRAFSVQGLQRIVNSDIVAVAEGYQLETFLNYFFKVAGKIEHLPEIFAARMPFKKGDEWRKKQRKEIRNLKALKGPIKRMIRNEFCAPKKSLWQRIRRK